MTRDTVLALYALHVLARTERLTSAAVIARQGGIPKTELGAILRRLREAGLVRGRPGHGYALGKTAHEISVEAVARVFEDPSAPEPSCIRRFDACAEHESCPLAPLCIQAHAKAEEVKRGFSLADLRLSPASVADCAFPPSKLTD